MRTRWICFRISFVAAWLLLTTCSTTLAAELRLRESLLQQQRDKVSITVTATVNHLGNEAHSLSTQLSSEDCDLHVPLRSREIRVSFIGEVKNACSEVPSGEGNKYWHNAIYDETHGRAVEVTGVFRIWLEHPPAAPNDTQSMVEQRRDEGRVRHHEPFRAASGRTYAERMPQRLILIDGSELARLMIRYNVGVRTARTIEMKKADLDYFEEDVI